MAHIRSSPLIVFLFSRWHLCDALRRDCRRGGVRAGLAGALLARHARGSRTHSDVMKEMNSDTHSWTVSFASLAILAVGRGAHVAASRRAAGRRRFRESCRAGSVRHYLTVPGQRGLHNASDVRNGEEAVVLAHGLHLLPRPRHPGQASPPPARGSEYLAAEGSARPERSSDRSPRKKLAYAECFARRARLVGQKRY